MLAHYVEDTLYSAHSVEIRAFNFMMAGAFIYLGYHCLSTASL